MSQHPNIIEIYSKYIYYLFLLPKHKANATDWVAVEFGFVSINQRIITVDSYYLVVIEDEEGKDLQIEFLFVLYNSKEFYNASYSKSYTISILTIYNTKY